MPRRGRKSANRLIDAYEKKGKKRRKKGKNRGRRRRDLGPELDSSSILDREQGLSSSSILDQPQGRPTMRIPEGAIPPLHVPQHGQAFDPLEFAYQTLDMPEDQMGSLLADAAPSNELGMAALAEREALLNTPTGPTGQTGFDWSVVENLQELEPPRPDTRAKDISYNRQDRGYDTGVRAYPNRSRSYNR